MRWSDLWKAPLHDFPIRDEILFQYLPLSPEMDLLEIGPGSGFTAYRLAPRVRELTLVDIAAENIARLKVELRDFPNLRFVCADVCKPGLAATLGGAFDAVFALAVFDLLPDPAGYLENIAAVLRRGGLLLLQFPNYPPPRSPGVTYFRTRAELERLVRGAGFEQCTLAALRLRPHARWLDRYLHQPSLKLYRRVRGSTQNRRALVYDESWAFRHAGRLGRYKLLLHAAWAVLGVVLRIGGDCFDLDRVGEEILDRNLLLVARR